MVHFCKLAQASAENFGNGLQAKTHTKHRNAAGCSSHDVKQPTGFTGKSRAGRQQDTVVVIDAFDSTSSHDTKWGTAPHSRTSCTKL